MSTWHRAAPSNHKVQAARCFPPQLSTASLSCACSYPPAGNHANSQLPFQETGKTWGHNHTGRVYHAFMASWTIQPFAQVFNFLAVPSTSRAKPKPNSSSILISCVVQLTSGYLLPVWGTPIEITFNSTQVDCRDNQLQ